MTLSFLALAGGLLLLLIAASALVRGSAALALRFGLSPLVVGLTVVAFGTSAPELVVSVQATRSGAGGIAAGNVVGSTIANVGLILALVPMMRTGLRIARLEAGLLLFAYGVYTGHLLLQHT